MIVNILYAEDSKVIRTVVSRFIQAAFRESSISKEIEFRVTLAETGAMAERILRGNPPGHFSVFFMRKPFR